MHSTLPGVFRQPTLSKLQATFASRYPSPACKQVPFPNAAAAAEVRRNLCRHVRRAVHLQPADLQLADLPLAERLLAEKPLQRFICMASRREICP